MKKLVSVVMASLFIFSGMPLWAQAASNSTQKEQEMRAVWMATVANIDFPSIKSNATAQKQEYINKLDAVQKMGMNTIIVQIRPKADALYRSKINPWSDVLTGVQGKDPGYDPLAFMLEEAHKRGLEFHAWLNPYRITSSGTDTNVLDPNHPARLYPDWVIRYNNALYYNPASAGVKKHIADTVEEILKKYDVDAIHFDDYFYPSNYPLPKGESRDGKTANRRRQHVNEMIAGVQKVIQKTKPEVKFGISPIGIWKNQSSDPTGSATNGNESYYSVYADTRAWIQNGWIDYVVPQIYWETGNKYADYETLVNWWSNEVEGTDVKLYIGHGVYKDIVAKQIDSQLQINRQYPNAQGSFFYGMKSLLANQEKCVNRIQNYR